MADEKKLIIVGAGEFGQMACEYFKSDSPYQVYGFAVEEQYIDGNELMGLPVVKLGEMPFRFPPSEYTAFVAVTFVKLNSARERLHKHCKSLGYQMASYISSNSFLGDGADIEPGAFIMENCSIQRAVKICEGAIVWCGCNIAHQTSIGKYTWIAPGVSTGGQSSIGPRCFVGVGSCIGDRVFINQDNVIGAGSVITKSVMDEECAFAGNPIKRLDDQVYRRFV